MFYDFLNLMLFILWLMPWLGLTKYELYDPQTKQIYTILFILWLLLGFYQGDELLITVIYWMIALVLSFFGLKFRFFYKHSL
ncbi:MAG: hypothetical protein FNT15_05745 [Sulfurovum sp.]|nr:MAG: hypothetical protein FNT15_05745 [Sulfurovum sp.]